MKSNRGDLPIHCSAKRGDIRRFKVLAERYLPSLQVRNGSGEIPLQVAAGISWGSSIVIYLLCLHHGQKLPPGVDLSEQVSHQMSENNEAAVSQIVAIMSVEHFPLALDRHLAQYCKLPNFKRQMVVHAVREFTKRLRQTTQLKEKAEHRLTAAKSNVERLTKQVEAMKLTVSEFRSQVDRGKERESSAEKKYSDLKSQVDQGKERESHLEKKNLDLESRLELERKTVATESALWWQSLINRQNQTMQTMLADVHELLVSLTMMMMMMISFPATIPLML